MSNSPTQQPGNTLGDALPREMARVRDEVLPVYLEIGPPGQFAATMMRLSLDRAAKAMMEGDLGAMMDTYNELKDYHV